MKVCVFGASGYVGASVYKTLKERPDINVAGTYLDEPAMFPDLYKLDVNDPESFSHFYKQESPDVVVWSVMSGPNEHELIDQGLMHLLTHVTPQTKVVYISSDFVFSEGNGPYEETDPTTPLPDDHLFHNYTNAKVKAERLIDNELSNYVILRAGPIYGENQIGKLDEYTDKLSYHLRSDKQIAFRDDLIRTFVHVEDLAKIIVDTVQNNVTGIYHVGQGDPQSFFAFMQKMAKQLGYDPDLVVKASEQEQVDQEIPKDTSLITKKIAENMKLNFR